MQLNHEVAVLGGGIMEEPTSIYLRKINIHPRSVRPSVRPNPVNNVIYYTCSLATFSPSHTVEWAGQVPDRDSVEKKLQSASKPSTT